MANESTSVVPFILGPNGEPARLSESQRTEAMLGSYDGFLAASFKIPPFSPDMLFVTKGYKILDDMMTMGSVKSAVNIVRNAALYKGVNVNCAVSDQADANYEQASEIAAALEYALSNIEDEAGNCQDPRNIVWELLYAVHTGFRVSEINWRVIEQGPYAGKLGFKQFAAKPCKQIGFDLDPQTLAVRNVTSYTPLNGYDFKTPVEKVLHYAFDVRDSLPYGNGGGRPAYKHYWSTDVIYKFWNIGMEMFGAPFILGKAPPAMMALARKAIEQIRQGAPAVLPLGVESELVEIAGTGLAGFESAVEHHCGQIAQIYLGSTLTTGEGQRVGSLALGQVHENTADYGLGAARADVEFVLNRQMVRRWVRYNYGQDALPLCPSISLGKWDAVDMDKLSRAFDRLVKGNMLHESEPVIRERLNIPPADPDTRDALAARSAQRDAGADPAPSSEDPQRVDDNGNPVDENGDPMPNENGGNQ